MILRCRKCNCNCIIIIIGDTYFRACTDRVKYYCQGWCEDKKSCEIYEVEE